MRSDDFAYTDDPSHRPSHPHPDCSATVGALSHPLAIRRSCAFGATQPSVAQGARLKAASCFHTLVSPIDSAAGLRAATVRIAHRTTARDQVRGHSPRLLGPVHEVLSIGKLGAGRAAAEYYLARQAGCLSEYYTGSGERRGVWLGRGAAAWQLQMPSRRQRPSTAVSPTWSADS